MTNQTQTGSRGPGCMQVMGILTLVMLVVMLVLGLLAWNAVGTLFGGISQGITGLGDSVGGAVGQTLEDLGETVDGIGQGVTELGEAVAALPQAVADAIRDTFFSLSEVVSNAVKEAIRDETRASIETKVLLAESITPMGTLVTASHPGDADVKVSIQSGPLNVCGASVDHAAEGTIEAGVDLSQVSAGDFTHDVLADSWVLKLGPAELHSCRIDYVRQLGHSLSVCQQDWDEYRLLAESDAVTRIRDEALAEGFLAKAEKEAERVLGNFMRAVTGSDNVIIVFESEPVTECPESCLREPPPEWRFDEESDSWVRE